MSDYYGWTYPDQFNNCVMCGAKAGEKCDTISEPETPREVPHFYRSKGQETAPPEGYAVRDEPDHWADNCPDPATCPFHNPLLRADTKEPATEEADRG